jgi:uncharacterized beta-barrel protein YwiB (DUF1934 family)
VSKEVMVSIRGVQYGADSKEPIEVICRGQRYERNDKTYVVYDEVVEESNGELSGVVKNTIKIDGRQIDILKRGPQGTHMVFNEDKASLTYYSTPAGELSIGIDTSLVELDMDEESIRAKVVYDLEINQVHIAQCEVEIRVL